MSPGSLTGAIDRIYSARLPAPADVEFLLGLESEHDLCRLFDFADSVRRQFAGDGIILRGIVEFSNRCGNSCFYCGLNRQNCRLERYSLSKEQILESAGQIACAGIGTVILQSGQDPALDAEWLADVVSEIKRRLGMTVTLSVGHRSRADYQLWKKAGADRYLLKIETADRRLYESLHADSSFDDRVRCTLDLKALGYQTGSGCIVGLKGQTVGTLACDIRFFAEHDFDMLGIGPFIPHRHTPLGAAPAGDVKMTLKVLAITRIVSKIAHLPATTAIETAAGGDGRIAALKAGANVIMLDFTPEPYRTLYQIYPGRKGVENLMDYISELKRIAAAIGRTIDCSRGDSLKKAAQSCCRTLSLI